jgi:RHS repeat-associated protein
VKNYLHHSHSRGGTGVGLSLYGQRLYDGDLGRFLMPDTIIPNLYEPQSHNPYSYCHNDPVNYIDPSGHYRRVPRIFLQGEAPDHQGLRIALLCTNVAGYLASMTCGYNNLYAVILLGNIAIKSIAPTVLARDGDTLTRGQTIARIGVDFLANMVAAGIGISVGENWLKMPLRGIEGYFVRRFDLSGELVRHATNLLRSAAMTGLAHSFSGQGLDWIDSFEYGLDIGINQHNPPMRDVASITRRDTGVDTCDDEYWRYVDEGREAYWTPSDRFQPEEEEVMEVFSSDDPRAVKT